MNLKDRALIEYIITNTENSKLRWEPTAHKHQFLVALRGQYTAMIESAAEDHDSLYLRNTNGEVILRVSGGEDNRVNKLFELARRNAYNVDHAIDEIISSGDEEPEGERKPGSGIEDEDIPF
jgi:hypothetical protein